MRLVELLYPNEELQRVNVVDTPGLNSIVDEHEQTAREFIAQADAIVWLFSADQAGKQTEELALETISKQRLKTVGVVNKIDRLESAQLEQVQRHLEAGFSELVEAIVPVSAKQALSALATNDPAALQRSHFPELRAFLEQRIFSRSRRLKREATARKLIGLGKEALERLTREQRSQLAARDRLTGARAALLQLEAPSLRSAAIPDSSAKAARSALVVSEQTAFGTDLLAVYNDAAAEVLDFVRPRRWALGSHRVEPADRDFLRELLLERLSDVAARSQKRVEAQLRMQIGAVHEALGASSERFGQRGPDLLAVLEEQLDLLREQVYTRFLAFSRGVLVGGRVEHFFREELADLELTIEPIAEALAVDTPAFEREFASSLVAWLAGACERFSGWLRYRDGELSVAELELSAAAIDPIAETVCEARKALADAEAIG